MGQNTDTQGKIKSKHDYERAAKDYIKTHDIFSKDELTYSLIWLSYDADLILSQNDIINGLRCHSVSVRIGLTVVRGCRLIGKTLDSDSGNEGSIPSSLVPLSGLFPLLCNGPFLITTIGISSNS